MPEWKEEIRERLANLKLAPMREAEILEELSQHLEDHHAQLLAGGKPPEEAYRETLAELSERDLLAHELRQVECLAPREPIVLGTNRRSNMMADLWQDLRYGLRMLGKHPGFTVIAALTLALGIGANTAAFSLVNAALLRSEAAQPEELVSVLGTDPQGHSSDNHSYAEYLAYREQTAASLAGLAAWSVELRNLHLGDQAERVAVGLVTANYFDVLKVPPVVGRNFVAGEGERLGTEPVALVSESLWRQKLGGRDDVVGRSIRLEKQNFTIVGVVPERVSRLLRVVKIPVFVPATMSDSEINRRDENPRYLGIIGRMRPQTTLTELQAQFSLVAARLAIQYPELWNADGGVRSLRVLPESEARIPQGSRPVAFGFMALIFGVLGIVLLIVCANLASFLLARGAERQQEIALRLALGAARGRIVRQLLTESMLLAILGGIGALVFAFWVAGVVRSFRPPMEISLVLDATVDARVLAFNLLVTLATTLLFGLFPAWQAAKPDLINTLKAGAAMLTHKHGRLRRLLVVAQLVVSMTLLTGGGLFLQHLWRSYSAGPGFDTRNLVVFSIARTEGFTGRSIYPYYERFVDRLRSLPGVKSVAIADRLPQSLDSGRHPFVAEGAADNRVFSVGANNVGPNYFETLGIPIVRGRSFNPSDRDGAPRVAIINEALAQRCWPGQYPIGKLIRGGLADATYEVVGVAGAEPNLLTGGKAEPFVYLPWYQITISPHLNWVVRTEVAPATMFNTLKRTLLSVDPDLAIFEMRTMEEHLAFSLLPLRLGSLFFGSFGVLALALAAIGLYGVMSYDVALRTREIGIRTALGAQHGDVIRLIMRDGSRMILAGIIIGSLLTVALVHVVSRELFRAQALEPAPFVVITLFLGAIALLACWLPARRAAKVDPMIALRQE
jgi:macrolide transport system ATP-binding/permease protein